jgi:hypothetical protein
MINREIAKSAISIAQEFDKRGAWLQAEPGTPLACLNESALLGSAADTSAEYMPDPDFIEAQSAGWKKDEQSLHSTQLNEMTVEIASYVQSHLNFARNVVRPVIQELVNKVQADIEALPVKMEYNLEIVVLDPPEPMISSSFEEQAHEYKDINYMPIRSYLNMPAMGAAEIIAMLVTGNQEVDAALQVWASKQTSSWLENVYNSVFTSESTSGRFEDLVQARGTSVDAALLVFVLGNKLYDNPPAGTEMLLAKYNEAIADVRNQSGLRIHQAYEEYARNSATGQLIVTYDKQKVSVNGNVYRKWMELGGNNAVIFGSILSDRPAMFVNELNDKKADFLSTWEQYNQFMTVTQRNQQFANYKAILHNALIVVAQKDLEACFGQIAEGRVINTSLSEYEQFVSNTDTFVNELNEDDFKNIWKLCLNAVCKCVFFYNDADKILSGIEKVCRDNPGIEVREAALLSTIEYVTDYLCNQMKLCS